MIFVNDTKGNLICVPYSIENLHKMAAELGIKRKYFKKNHYKITNAKIWDKIKDKNRILETDLIGDIIRRPDLADDILGSWDKTDSSKGIGFLVTQMHYKGNINKPKVKK